MTNKLALLGAAASLMFAGAAFAQTTTTPNTISATPPTLPSGSVQSSSPATAPPQSTAPQTTMPQTTMPQGDQPSSAMPPAAKPPANPADSAAQPSSANVATDFKVGMSVKDSQGVSVGQITGSSTGADGSTNVIVTNGGVKFALPANSLSATADGGVQTTATKAQIDATVAGAKPQ